MERIQALIDKLYQQKQENAQPAQLLFTVQLLQSELVKLQQKNGTLGTAKVAVTMPVSMNFAQSEDRSPAPEVPQHEPAPEPVPAVAEAPRSIYDRKELITAQTESVAPPQQPVAQPAYESREYRLRKPMVTEDRVREEYPQPAPSKQVLNPAFSTSVETPTLSQHIPQKEIHEVIGEAKESLNDRLKQEKTEVVHVLKDTPIKDLRKGIGINDRFTFVNELFRGDEAMYERSIKTINGFHILSEAEYWINRELKFKLGWNDNKDTVQHFYHLVRRRFA